MVEVLDSGMQAEKFLCTCPALESLLLSLLTSCRPMRLFNYVVAARSGDHLLVVNVSQARDLPDRGSIAQKLVGVNDFWDIVFTKQSDQNSLRSFGIAMPLKENIEHETVLVDRSPQPMPDAIHRCAYLVQVPAGTPSGFPLAQFLRKERAEFDAPLAKSLVAHLDTALVEQFLNIPVTQWKAVVQPNCMLDDRHWETVAIGLGIGHGQSAYPDPVKATQPYRQLRARGSLQKSPWWPWVGSCSALDSQSSPQECRTTKRSKASEKRLPRISRYPADSPLDASPFRPYLERLSSTLTGFHFVAGCMLLLNKLHPISVYLPDSF